METIPFTRGLDVSPYCYIYTRKRLENGNIKITGVYHNHTWIKGQIIDPGMPARSEFVVDPKIRTTWEVVEVLKQRDAKGKFTIPEHAKNSFFELELKPILN